jgi:hypothetical protein
LKTEVFGKEVWNERLAKICFGADSKNLKMRRLPPTCPPQQNLSDRNHHIPDALFKNYNRFAQ